MILSGETFVSEIINVDISARCQSGVIIDGETGSHEEPAVVKYHLEIRPYRLPIFSVGAEMEAGYVASGSEISLYPEIDAIRPKRKTPDFTVADIGNCMSISKTYRRS